MIPNVLTSSNAKIRLILWTGLLLIEASLVATFFFPAPQPHKQRYDTHPALRFEMDTVVHEHPLLGVAAIAFLGLFIVANVGLMIVIWRAFKDVQARD